MASTWSNLGLRLMATGENDNTWGAQTNDNWNRMEDSTDGYMSVALSSTSHTATFTTQPTSYADEEGRQRVINYTGSPGGTCTVTLPNIEKVYVVRNNTDQSLIFTAGTGAQTVTLASGFDAQIYVDGSDEVHNCFDQMTGSVPTTAQVVTALSGATLTGALTIDNDLTLQGAAANIVFDESDNALEFADDAKAIFGAGGDLLIHHNGANSLIDSNTGELQILSDNIRLKNAANNETLAEFTNGSSCVFKFNDGTKLATTDTGVTVTGDMGATTATTSGTATLGGIAINDGSLRAQLVSVSSDIVLKSETSDKDIKFQGVDGGSTVTALTLDMSEAGAATFNNNVTAFSDERLKTDIKTIESGLDKVSQMRGVTFKKDDKLNSGVVAQELEKIAPELVKTADDEMGTKSVAYGNMVGYLIEAVKELKVELDNHKKNCHCKEE